CGKYTVILCQGGMTPSRSSASDSSTASPRGLSRSRLGDPAGEALVCLLTGEVVVEGIVEQGVGGVVARVAENVADPLGGAEGVGQEDRVGSDAGFDKCRACNLSARA